MSNHLANQNSPYLLQHSDNPVDWYPWGEEAFEKARQEDKPIFLSIGYAACHWCHVMAHESFEDPKTAALMNKDFINIKVDREERPDLDSIYMTATVSMSGSGGWPMSVFLTPDLRPFYAGTYFPPAPRFNMPSFQDILMGIANAWINDREEIFSIATRVVQNLKLADENETGPATSISEVCLDQVSNLLAQTYDWEFGGWGKAPKFPQPMAIEFLLRQSTHSSTDLNSDDHSNDLKIAEHVLQAMARGGMYDVVAGGFARYSVDNPWRTPHFEKMLYDNAQLAVTYLHAYMLTGELKFRQVCEETLDFILRELTHPLGGFYSSLDADSEGKEGKFYVWDYSEIRDVLEDDFELFEVAYGLTPSGNWEGKIILQRTLDDNSLAAKFTYASSDVAARLSDSHARLLHARDQRVRPGTDDKILVFWNALALTAFAEAGRYLNRKDYLDVATHNARFLLDHLYINDRLLRSWRDGQARHNAYLEDYASLSLALLALYQSDPNPEWYATALKLADEMVENFIDPRGGFFDTRSDHEALLLRPKDIQDNATPSGNALAAEVLLLLASYGDRIEWRKMAEDMLSGVMESMKQNPVFYAKWLCVADFAVGPILEVAVVGEHDHPQTQALLHMLWKNYRPRQVIAVSVYPPGKRSPALLNDRPLYKDQPSAYVCRGFVCKQPVNTPEELEKQLTEII